MPHRISRYTTRSAGSQCSAQQVAHHRQSGQGVLQHCSNIQMYILLQSWFHVLLLLAARPSPLGLLQEMYPDPWQHILCCVLCSRTSGSSSIRRCVAGFFDAFPTPTACLQASDAAMSAVIHPLGLTQARLAAVRAVSKVKACHVDAVCMPVCLAVTGRFLLRQAHTVFANLQKDIFPPMPHSTDITSRCCAVLTLLPQGFLATDWEVPSEFRGCGKFVTDSWRIFCKGCRDPKGEANLPSAEGAVCCYRDILSQGEESMHGTDVTEGYACTILRMYGPPL